MSLYSKKLHIKKLNGVIQTANLYTDKSDVGNNYLTFKDGSNIIYSILDVNGDIDCKINKNHVNYKIKHEAIQWKTDEYRISKLYPSITFTMTELPNDRDWVEFVRYRKDLNGMFRDCYKLTKVPLFDTQNVTDMAYMFLCCDDLTTVPLFDTSNVTNMNSMFCFCLRLTTVPLFNTQNVTNINGMFRDCYKLTKVPLFDTSNVTNMFSMFYGCSNLIELPIFDIRNVKYINNMIFGTKIKKITFKNKPANLEITPAILGKADVQITFI